MFLFLEGIQSQNILILLLFSMKRFYRLTAKINPDVKI